MIISPVGNYNLSGLMPGASYDFYLVDSCALGISPPAFLNVTTPTAPLPVIGYSATQTATTMSNAVVTFDASNSANYTSIKWEFGDGTPNGTNALEAHTYTMNQSYTVTLTLTNGCGSVDSTFTVNVMGIGLDETEIGQTLSIFPNPTDGKFNVAFEVTDNQDITIRVMDAIGRAVLVKDLGNVNGAQNVSLDLSNNASGIYMVQIVTDEGTITKRLTLRNK